MSAPTRLQSRGRARYLWLLGVAALVAVVGLLSQEGALVFVSGVLFWFWILKALLKPRLQTKISLGDNRIGWLFLASVVTMGVFMATGSWVLVLLLLVLVFLAILVRRSTGRSEEEKK